ncbi:MAG: hypothetical protein ACYDEJ_16410 [Desulfitobacteriaceae bacterium]
MNKREIASLACKILGIYMIIQVINILADIFFTSMAMPNQIVPIKIFNIISPFIFFIIFGVLLWIFSDKLSTIMVTGENHSNEGSYMKASDIQRVSFSVLGLFFFGNSLPKIVSTLTNIYSISDSMPDYKTRLLLGAVGAIVQFIVGLGIFLGSQGLVNFLNIIRTAGLKRKDDYEEKE